MQDNIKLRRSIREFNDRDIDSATIKDILEAAMMAPSAINARDYAFVIIKDKEKMAEMAKINGKAARPLLEANVAILVCGDLSKSYSKAKDYWIINAAAAIENILLKAHSLGIGSLWIGTYTQMNKVDGQKELFNLPEHIIPHSIVALGYPKNDEELKLGSRDYYDESCVHYERW